MAVIRLILLVAVLGGLTLLLAQNWSPLITLNFLGIETQALPLAIWILFSVAAGALTSVFITTVFKLSNYFGGQQRQTRFQATPTSPRANTTRRAEPTPPPASPPPVGKQEYTANEVFDDWNTDGSGDDDWDFEQQPQGATTPKQQTQESPDSQTYERQQEPKSSSGSGSVYSYNYREPKNTAVGKTESIYDADYRVIIPPYQPPAKNQADEDDWSFFEDDEDDEQSPR
ncbi:MAG: LapA family protein [Goleter apudmare HA4340-LM2]|jgi:uncharacterized integral membrane protein|nr:LapA family protein [Goleter apudmare HA4340-LM2]